MERHGTSAKAMKRLKDEAKARHEDSFGCVLASGVLLWLEVCDAVQLLSTCTQFRRDSQLTVFAIAHCTKDGRHFFQRCSRDWFRIIKATNVDSLSTVCSIRHIPDDVCNTLRQHIGPESAYYSPASCLNILSGIGRMQKKMTMFVKDGVQADTFRGLVIPISRSMTSEDKLATEAEESLLDCAGPSTAEPQPLSTFGAHWESMTVVGRGCTSSCALCSSCVDAVCRYREETEVFAKRFEELLIRQEDIWEQAGWSEADICELAFSFQQAYFQNEPFYNTYVAALDDSGILRYLCQQGRYAFPKNLSKYELPGNGEDPDALSAHFRESCRIFYQPLKEFMHNATIRDVNRFLVAPHINTECGAKALDVVVGFVPHTLIGIYVVT